MEYLRKIGDVKTLKKFTHDEARFWHWRKKPTRHYIIYEMQKKKVLIILTSINLDLFFSILCLPRL